MAFIASVLAAGLSLAAVQEPQEPAEAAIDAMVDEALDAPVEAPGGAAALELLAADPDPRALVCPFKGRIEYDAGDLSCGTITVPENREAEASRTIRLMYVHMPATGEAEDRREDPIIYLTGGPGVPVESYVERLRDHPVFETRDLYILEQRGIANSGVFCPQYGTLSPDLSDPRSFEELEQAGAERMALCFSEARARGVDLRGYNTQENARDVKALREALGYEQWNIWGISYGSHLGQMVMQEDPQGVRAILLDAIVPNDLGGGFGDFGRMIETVLDNYKSACPSGAPCDGFVGRMNETLDRMQDDPIIIKVDDPETAPSGEVWIPPAIVVAPAFVLAYEHEEHPAVPAVTNALSRLFNDPDPKVLEGLGAALAEGGAPAPFGAIAEGMSAAIRCNDGYVAESLDDQASSTHTRYEGVFFSEAGSRATLAVCQDFGLTRRTGPAYDIPAPQMPTLIVNGEWDPVTPPWLAEYIHDRMPGSRLVIAPHAGHGPTRAMPECAAQVMTDFFDTPDLDALDASCLEAGVDAPAYPEFVDTRVPERALALMAGAPQSFIGPAIWAGAPILILLLGLVLIVFGFLARLVDRHPATELAADTSGARVAAVVTAATALAGLALLGAGGYAAYEITPVALAAGLLAPAGLGVWLILGAGGLGLLTLALLVRARGTGRIRFGTLTGFALIGLSGPALAALVLWLGLSPL
ncbi:MAG: alpha/beta hydrolase [Oceanicaulis sp.]